MMLDGASNDVAPLTSNGESYTLQGKVICFSPATGKDNLLIPGTNKVGNPSPYVLNIPLCLLPTGIDG